MGIYLGGQCDEKPCHGAPGKPYGHSAPLVFDSKADTYGQVLAFLRAAGWHVSSVSRGSPKSTDVRLKCPDCCSAASRIETPDQGALFEQCQICSGFVPSDDFDHHCSDCRRIICEGCDEAGLVCVLCAKTRAEAEAAHTGGD